VGAALAVLLTGCASGDVDTAGSSAPTAADTEAHRAASGVCRVLVAFDHTVADEVNAASRQITAETDPEEARALLLEATDEIRRASDFLPERYAALSVTGEGDLSRLVADATAATAAVDEQLDRITAELTDGLDGEGPREILSAVFIDMEKVQSLAQPDQSDYADADLLEQLDTLDACQHTISR
jgi:hypothetical protein